MADTKSNLEKFNKLVNPDNEPAYYKSKDKKGPNANRVPAKTMSECYDEIDGEYKNIKMASHRLGLVDIDVDDENEMNTLTDELDEMALNYVLVKTSKKGHYHIILKRPDDLERRKLVNGMKHSWISDDYKYVGPDFLMYWGPILPTPYNDRKFLIIPETLDEMPEHW